MAGWRAGWRAGCSCCRQCHLVRWRWLGRRVTRLLQLLQARGGGVVTGGSRSNSSCRSGGGDWSLGGNRQSGLRGRVTADDLGKDGSPGGCHRHGGYTPAARHSHRRFRRCESRGQVGHHAGTDVLRRPSQHRTRCRLDETLQIVVNLGKVLLEELQEWDGSAGLTCGGGCGLQSGNTHLLG